MGENSIFETLKSEEAKQLLPKIYEDMFQPGVRKVGTALGTVLDLSNTILLPIRLINEKTLMLFQKHMDSYKTKLDKVPEENIVDVPTEIGLPILERLTYTTNEEVADLLTTLLAKASDEKTVNQAHPGFVQILQRLSVDEARIIRYLGTGKRISPIITARVDVFMSDKEPVKQISVPIDSIHYIALSGDRRYIFELYDLFRKTEIHYAVTLLFPENVSAYLDNLTSMGILRPALVGDSMNHHHKEIIKRIREDINRLDWAHWAIPILDKMESEGTDLFFSRYDLTDYGILFVAATNGN